MSRLAKIIIASLENNVHHLADEWFGVYGGHAHLKKFEIMKALFDFFATWYLTLKCWRIFLKDG